MGKSENDKGLFVDFTLGKRHTFFTLANFLSTLTFISSLLALTAASPCHRGLLVDTDCRWVFFGPDLVQPGI